eukprot:sb/3464558/
MIRFLLFAAVLCGTAVVLTDWTAVEREVKIPWDLEATPLQIKTDSTLDSGDMIRVKVYDKDSKYITSADWTAVQRGVRIPWDLEGTSLQIKTDSTLDSNDVIMIDMYDYESTTIYIGNVRVMITSPNVMYYLIHCAAWDVLPVQPPEEVEKIWTITKTETALIITCNDVIVLNYLFADSANGDCVPRWGGDFADSGDSRCVPRWGESDVEEIRFKDVTDTASDFYKGAPPVLSGHALTTVLARSDNWTAVQRGVRIPWDLEGTSLQIKTDSTHDSNDVIMIDMYDYESTTTYIGNVRVMITSPNVMYYLIHCAAWDVLPVQPPEEVEKIWTISKTETALIITCNDVIVLNYMFTDSANGDCVPMWGGDVKNIEFTSGADGDSASDFYRAAPVDCPAFTVERSTQGNWDVSPTGTIVIIDCVANHILVGSATLTCQEDGTWSSDVPKCDTIGKCGH